MPLDTPPCGESTRPNRIVVVAVILATSAAALQALMTFTPSTSMLPFMTSTSACYACITPVQVHPVVEHLMNGGCAILTPPTNLKCPHATRQGSQGPTDEDKRQGGMATATTALGVTHTPALCGIVRGRCATPTQVVPCLQAVPRNAQSRNANVLLHCDTTEYNTTESFVTDMVIMPTLVPFRLDNLLHTLAMQITTTLHVMSLIRKLTEWVFLWPLSGLAHHSLTHGRLPRTQWHNTKAPTPSLVTLAHFTLSIFPTASASPSASPTQAPTAVPLACTVKTLHASDAQTCVTHFDGMLRCWGRNGPACRLGIGDSIN
eukprot:Hpha_TRINITY_DN16588_c2_g2::TRINITY_DN16588_c2_g2_i1::g.133899::m.133899